MLCWKLLLCLAALCAMCDEHVVMGQEEEVKMEDGLSSSMDAVTGTEVPATVAEMSPTTPKKDHKKEKKQIYKKKEKSYEENDSLDLGFDLKDKVFELPSHDFVDTTVSSKAMTNTKETSVMESETTPMPDMPTMAEDPHEMNHAETTPMPDVPTMAEESHEMNHAETTSLPDMPTMAEESHEMNHAEMTVMPDMTPVSTESPAMHQDHVETTVMPDMTTIVAAMNHGDFAEKTKEESVSTIRGVVEETTTTTMGEESPVMNHGVVSEEEMTKQPITDSPQTTVMDESSKTPTIESETTMTTPRQTMAETTTLIPQEEPTTLLITTEDNEAATTSNLHKDADTTTLTYVTEEPTSSRRHKQMDLDKGEDCACGGPSPRTDDCVGGRTLPDPACSCRSVCAGQAGQSCSPSQPCDAEFGLVCNSEQNNTCQGPLSIEVFDVAQTSAKVQWNTNEQNLHPEALVYYTSSYRGPHTQWTKHSGVKPVINLSDLLPGKNYYVKIEEDGKFEIASFKTKGNAGNMPKILVKQRSQTSMTVVWDDFRLPSYHSEYILEYKPSDDTAQDWTKVNAGPQTIVTVTHLKPNTPYDMKVAVWEDGKLELPSEVITAYTADGCVKDNRMYNVGEEYFLECDFRCVCEGSNSTSCTPRCNTPYVKIGSKIDDPLCYEKPLSSDPCCVTIRCSESKFYGDNGESKNKSGECPEILEDSESESKSCLSDCDHDGDCSGSLKCCPSSCGGAVCVQPLLPEDVCEHIYCGPNAVCVAKKMSCECAEGYDGNPHDFLNGCVLANMTDDSTNDTQGNRSGFELNLDDKKPEMKNGDIAEGKSDESEFKNELETESQESTKNPMPTETPFQLDLTSNNSSRNLFVEDSIKEDGGITVINSTIEEPNEKDNFHLDIPQGSKTDVKVDESMDDMNNKSEVDVPMPFDGCEYNNITYDRGVTFEDGCEARCTCDGGGHVSCIPRCPVLQAGSPSCKEVPDPDDRCCKIMLCSFPGGTEKEHVDGLPFKILSAEAQNGTAVRVRLGVTMTHLPTMIGKDLFEVWFRESSDSDNDLSQWNKKLVSKNELTEVQHGVFEFDIIDLMPQTDYYIKVGRGNQESDMKMVEFSNTVNVKTFPAAVKTVFQGCFHHNQSYSLGEIFYQGCEHKCICREKGFIECQDRCEIYIDTVGYEGCDWVPSEEDPCCTIPMCNRRKIPLLPDGRMPFSGNSENICVVDNTEIYRVGDIWESGDGCKTKICRCTLLSNGSTSIQCQSECPPLAPNAHIPTARCPHPVLIKPDGPCSCPYVVCNDAPRRVVQQPPRPQCEFKGQRYDMGQEFHDGCIALCHCGQDLRVNCAAIECPYHFSAEFTNCLEWDIDPDFFPTPPHCCAPAKCKNDGSCMFSSRKFANFEDIPTDLLPCGARCVCVNGNVTCENRCTPIEDVPPVNLPCSPNLAFKGHPEGETCCLQWMCKEPLRQNYCMFQGSRYLVSEQWEVHKGSQLKMCTCHLNEMGAPEVECRGGCPQIPQRFLLPTEQCLRPVIVTPDDPLMCPYVVCNNTVSGQELYNVNVVALNSTAVRVRFSLSNILVGLIGHAELHFTTDPTLPPAQWHVQKFSRPKRLFDSPNIEYILNALRPNTTYFLQVKIKIDALQGGPESELFKLKMPEEIVPTTTTTTVPPLMIIDAKAEAHVIDSKTVRISWRNFEPQEKKYIYALQLKYKLQNEADDKWITTPMIHRDVTSYFLHDLEPSADYVVDVIFTPPKDFPTKIVSAKGLEFRTTEKMKEDYHLQVAVEDNKVEEDRSSFSFAGIPEPVTKYVHVIKIMYKSSDGDQSYSFKEPKNNHIMLDHLKPGKKYLAQLELYLTNGQTLTSNEVEFITKPAKPETNVSESENIISQENVKGKHAELMQHKDNNEEENKAYFIALVVVAVVAAVAAFGFILLLVLLVRRQASAKAPISRTPSESAYDNPTYKTYDGERPEDKTNGQTIQTTQA